MAEGPEVRRDIVIRSEDEAWDLLQRVEAGEFGDQAIVPRFDGWPATEITFWLGTEHETLTAPMMEALLDVQNGLYRSYMLIEEGTTNLRSLSNEQRRELEVRFQVGEGCTKLLPDLEGVAEKFAEAAVKHMSGTQITVVILVFILAVASHAYLRTWLENRTKKAEREASNDQVRQLLAAQKYASEADERKTELMMGAIERAMGTRALVDASDEGRQGLLRAASRVDSTEVADVEIAPAVAKRVARNARSETEYERIEGRYRVVRVDANPDDGYRVRLEDVDTEQTFFANVRDALASQQDKATIADAEWGKFPIFAQIETAKRRGEIVAATVIAVRKYDAN